MPQTIIAAELDRQRAHGFFKDTTGSLIGRDISFQIKADEGKLVVFVNNLRYRIGDENRHKNDGSTLMKLPIKSYAPFHYLIGKVVPIIGRCGLAKISVLDDSEDEWRWIESEEMLLDEALKKYRWANFTYEASSPLAGKRRNGLKFLPHQDPNVKFGQLVTYFVLEEQTTHYVADVERFEHEIEQIRDIESILK